MAKTQINTKSSAYLKDKEAFLKELKQFNDSKNIPYKIPTVNGIDIDLYHFYSLVQQKGGLGKVNQYDQWDSFLRPLRLPHPCINGSTLLKKIYSTYLEKYERAKGPPGRDDDNDLDEDPRRGRGGPMPRIMFSGGTYISASGEALRTTTPRVAGPSERLCLSLLSPMPNEHDFAVNVCTVLAADYSNRLPLSSMPHILDFLLAHAGVYNHFFRYSSWAEPEKWSLTKMLAADYSNGLSLSKMPHILDFLLAHAGVYNHPSLRDTIGRSYFEARGRYPDDFWRMRAGGGGAKELADETKFMQPGLEQPELMVQALAAHNTLTACLEQEGEDDDAIEKVAEEENLEDWVTEPSEESQLFAPELPGGANCVYTQRVLQISSIVRALSFCDENVPYLAKNTTLIRFLLLCANCWVGTLRQSGLDTLGNIATELIIKDPATCLISRHVLSTIQSALVSPDRARVLAALELLNKLAQNEANEDALLKALEAKVYSDVCALMTLRDIMVLVCTLECVYALTSLGDRASEAVARVPGLVHTLVSLVTVEAQSYGPRACILMRVVETVSGPSALAAAAAEQQQQQTQAQQQPQQTAQPPKPPPPESPAPAPAPAAPSAPPVSNIQQSHMQQRAVQENEHFAQAWLRSTYEALPPTDNSACESGEVYRQYIACCSKLSRKGVIAPHHFPRLVRTVFGGTVGPNTVTLSTGETQQAYIGIRAKNPPPKTTQPGPSSPILKAQLTNKTGPVETKPVVSQVQNQPQTHPHVSQALEASGTSGSNTSLIKHLLAHKVSPALHAPQVAQRQQNQQQRVPATNVVVQPTSSSSMEAVDPEALIKCTTITPGGVASSTPTMQGDKVIINAPEEQIVPKEESIQIQLDDQAQLTFKTAANKMLADLLERKSNPPVQVIQMGSQINAPTIQITETGQIVQVKSDSVIQINPDPNTVTQGSQYYQIKNEQGQIVQIKNDQGQIIQLKSDQVQPLQFKNEQGQIVQIKSEGPIIQGGQIIQQALMPGLVKTEKNLVESVVTDHSYTEPPSKKQKMEDKRESNNSPQESVSKTAANLYAALAASALEDEEDLIPPKQEPTDVIQPSVLVSGADSQVIIQEPILQVQQPSMQIQQPTLQIQQPTLQVQQPTLQVQAPTLQVQQPTLQVQQPMLQVQPMDMQNIIASQSGQLILQEKTMAGQATQFVQQPMQLIAAPGSSQGGLSYITQNIPGNMMQKTIIIVQGPTGGGPLTLTVNNPGGLDDATLNSLITQATEAITQQQIIQNSGVIQSTQRVIVSQPALVSTSQHLTMVKPVLTQNAPQITQSQQPIITTQPQPIKAQIVNQSQGQQIVVTQKQPPALVPSTTQQIIQGNQQLLQGNQQIIAVSNNQQIIMNAPMKPGVHRVVQPQRGQVAAQSEPKPTPTQAATKPQQPLMRQVITRQPVMVGNNKIGDKEVIVNQPVPQEKPAPPAPPAPAATPPPSTSQPPAAPAADDNPWICHWRGCGKTFENATEVFAHAAKTHCPSTAGGEAPCLWADCDRVPRRTFALLNHITDKHCTPRALKAMFLSRRRAEAEASKPVSVGYPPNAALAALNKHATDMFNPKELMHRAELGRTQEQMDENEGPVTKSIRLTAALILRNIVIYSNTGRRQLRTYESHLATIAFSTVEASRTIAQVLYDMNNI